MIYISEYGVIKERSKPLMVAIAVGFAMSIFVGMFGFANAAVVPVNGCDFDQTAGMWTLQDDCTSWAQIDIPSNTVVDGDGHTISAGFAKTTNSNNAVFGIIGQSDVTIENVTIDGSGGTNLHSINVYVSTGVLIDGVTITDSNRSAVVVNGSEVTVNDITTSGSGWHAINVAQGGGVTDPADLTVTGVSSHTDSAHIYLDDATQDVSVTDVEDQYNVLSPVVRSDDKLYTLKVRLDAKDECKKGGWTASENPVFNNQGDCVSYFSSTNSNGSVNRNR